MADNVVTQTSALASLPTNTTIGAVEGSFSGDTVKAGLTVVASSAGSEGSRTLTIISPATSGGQDTGNTSVASIDTKTPSLGQALAAASVPVVLTAAQISTLTPTTGLTDTQLRATAVPVSAVLTAGSAVVGHVINDTGSTTAVTGNVTVVQPTGTNLHVVTDSGTITTVSAVTAISNALPAGSNVIGHVIADSGSTTAVTGNVAGTVADGANVTLGAKADAKNTATDTTSVSVVSVLKQISASVQAPPSQAVTNAGTFAAQAAITAASGSIASGAIASGAVASGAIASGAVASGAFAAGSIADGADVTMGTKADAKSTATDTTSISAMSVLKQISASVQAPPTQAVTNAGTFVVQENGAALTSLQLIDDAVVTLGTTTYAEATTKALVMSAIRRDANTTLVDTTNEMAPLQVDASGSLKVAITAGAGSGGTSAADESAFTMASASLTPIGGVYNSTPDTLTTGKAGVLQMTQARGLHVNIVDTAGASLAVAAATDSTGAGIIPAGILAQFDDVATSAVTENQFAHPRISSRRALLVEGVASGTAQPTSIASGGVASGAVASGAFASGALASGSVASGALASGAISDGADVTFGSKADAKNTATDTTSITAMSVLKQISASVQAPPSQAVTNAGTFVVQAGLPVTADTNSGVKSASTIRVVIATDQPALTNKLLVTPDSVALPANQSVNVAQLAGTTTDTNSGSKSAGTLRVVIATDQPQITAKTLVTPDASGLSARVSVTRPSDTTAYGAGDVVGVTGGGTATITFALGAISAGRILITSASLERDATALISGETSYTLHLYDVTQPGAQADNAVWDLVSGDRTAYLGSINLGTPVDLGSTLYVGTDGINKQVKLAGTSIFGVLVTTGAYTPVSAAVHVVTLHAVQL